MSTSLQTLASVTGDVYNLSTLREFLNKLHAAWNNDPEVAHGIEDQIKSRALQLAAEGHPDAARIAREVLVIDTWDDVMRWYA